LQWFAAEDEGRTEEPSEQRIRKAREDEGRVAKSQELVGALMLLLPALAIVFLARSMLGTCIDMIRFYFIRSTELDPTKDALVYGTMVRFFARLAAPIAAVAVLTAIISNVAQVGFLFTTKPLAFKFSRVVPNFGQYFSRTLFSVNGLFNFAKSIVKILIIGVVAFLIISSEVEKLANLQSAGLYQGFTLVASLSARLLIVSALLMLALSVPDYMFQRWQYRESLRMTKQEVREEFKEVEGDPQIKQRLRQRMKELLSGNIRESVPKADVVITNPTHFAVALEYKQDMMDGPKVLAKGEDEVAQRIKAIAREAAVPIVENKPLARALYADVEVGDIVPVKYWEAIAIILARVMGMR
jgi:flagellar biosynthetic protein FlhB